MKKTHKIFDSLHGFIRFSQAESFVIDSLPFQRLRNIKQGGLLYLLYPGATHTRFEHSLGVMEIATKIFERLLDPEALDELPRHVALEGKTRFLKNVEKLQKYRDYFRMVVRFAALCHDLGHVPFSHTIEKAFLDGERHEWMTVRIVRSRVMRSAFAKAFESAGIEIPPKRDHVSDILVASVDKEYLPEDVERDVLSKMLAHIVVNDCFGADRMDYLLRDAKCSGVISGNFDYKQLIDCVRLFPYKEISIGVTASGIQAVEGLLFSRYLMYSRVYHHPTVLNYSKVMHSLFERYLKDKYDVVNLDSFLSLDDLDLLHDIKKIARSKENPGYELASAIIHRRHRFQCFIVEVESGSREKFIHDLYTNFPSDRVIAEPYEEKKKKQKSATLLVAIGKKVRSKELKTEGAHFFEKEKNLVQIYTFPEEAKAMERYCHQSEGRIIEQE